MTSEQQIWLIGGILLAILFAVGIPMIIIDFKKNKDKYIITKEQMRAWEDERLDDEGEIITFRAEVVDMACGVKMIGYQAYKQPKAVKQFIISFKNDDGEILRIPVTEEIYEGFDTGLTGTLTLIDGQLDSFEPDNEH